MQLRAGIAALVVSLVLLAPSPGALGLGTSVAHAHTFVEMSLGQLAKTANRVIVGIPVEATSLWEEDGGGTRIVTYHRVRVHADVVGAGPQEVWVRRLGGAVDGIGQIVFGAEPLHTNQPVLLFLVAREDSTFSVVGMHQGCFPVTISKDRKAIVESRRLDRAPLPMKPGSVPASSIEGRDLDEAKRIILEARSRNAT